ncbi:MAG: hypothetical protein KDA45_02750 [Planctomycetales bacterium]|nr:hypothetical protein [Planctomycetales bacterium]
MNVSHSDSGATSPSQESFVGLNAGGDPGVGFASLDTPLVQQTKSEIRSLAAEIAQLAHAGLDSRDFYEGFLPRLCMAMGAKGAAVWQLGSDERLRLAASHALAPELLQGTQPSEAHLRILRCVIAEGQPILVPPGSVNVEAERPTNPLQDALLIVPLRIQETVEYLLEVVQRPSGGPAAQRGYLRFVAQMADLMADYIRRQQLRTASGQQQRLQRIEQWLTAIASASTVAASRQAAVDALRELFGGERAMLLTVSRRARVQAVSGTAAFDARSAVVLAAQALAESMAGPAGETPPDASSVRWMSARDRRQGDRETALPGTPERTAAHNLNDTPATPIWQTHVDTLCELLGCRQLLYLPMNRSGSSLALLAYAETQPQPQTPVRQPDSTAVDAAQLQLARSIGTLAGAASSRFGGGLLWKWGLLPGGIGRDAASPQGMQAVQRWLARLAILGLIISIALFPVPQQISATAILQPLSKQMYYAPASGVVSQVFVDEGDAVDAEQSLLQITSHELEATAESLEIEAKKIAGQIAEKTSRLNRGEDLRPSEKDQLEYDLQELNTTAKAVQLQRSQAQERQRELTVVARQPGTVSSWDLRNRMLNHPVQPGQLLAATFDPQGPWRLQLAVPDYRAGMVAAALQRAEKGAVHVQFSLASHPDQLLDAYAIAMASQVTGQSGAGSAAAKRVVNTEAVIRDATQLPLKKDGAIARATIACGKVPLCWLVFRDAYWALSSRAQMLW